MDRRPESSTSRDISSSTMASTDYEAMLHDISNQMAKSQLLRRLSTHSSTTSDSSKRVSARVTKLGSGGNSPHYVQRRRTTASSTTRSQPQYQTRDQRLQHYYNPRGLVSMDRPVSWHPGSDSLPGAAGNSFTSEPFASSPTVGLGEGASFRPPGHSVQQSIQDAFSMGYGYSISSTPSTHEQPAMENLSYSPCTPDSMNQSSAYSTFEYTNLPHGPYGTQASLYDIYSDPTFQMPQWSRDSQYTSPTGGVPEPVDSVPLQHITTDFQHLNTKELPPISKKKSHELVGIGLYDNEDKKFLNSANSELPTRESVGKDLKLEETWQLPDQDAEEVDDDVNSEDEAEPAEEASPNVGSVPAVPQTAFYPAYGDLSNQSFFLGEDEHLVPEDPYANYLAFDPVLQQTEPKLQAVRAGNLLWY